MHAKTGAAATLLGHVAGCSGAVGAPLSELAQQYCQLSSQLSAAEQGVQALQAQAALQQGVAALRRAPACR